jgi:sugar-specific transcriptional regulator TrmB
MIKLLTKLGFSERHAKIYFAALEIGEAFPVSVVAKKTGINRSTVYYLLEELNEEGLVVEETKSNIKLYRAQPPEYLVKLLEQKSQKYAGLAVEAKEALPELNSHYRGEKNWPRVYFYEGTAGLIRVYEETLNSSEEILAYASDQANQEEMPNYFPEYYKRRAAAGIPIRAIFTDSPEDRERNKLDKKELRRSRLVPRSKISFTPEINFFDNKIMIADWTEKIGIIIESAEIAKAFKQTFELAWEAAEGYHQEILKDMEDTKD